MWVNNLTDDDEVGAMGRRVITELASRCDLGPGQIRGCLVYYVLHQAAATRRDPLRALDAKIAAMQQLERVCEIHEEAAFKRMFERRA